MSIRPTQPPSDSNPLNKGEPTRVTGPGSQSSGGIPASDGLGGTIPVAYNTPAPPTAGAVPISPPPPLAQLLEKIGARIDAIDELGLSPEAAKLLLAEVDKRHPLA